MLLQRLPPAHSTPRKEFITPIVKVSKGQNLRRTCHYFGDGPIMCQVKAGNLCSSSLPPLGSMEYFCRGQHEVQFFSVADYEAWKAGGLYPLQRLIPEVHRHGKRINGHFRNLNWRYLPYIRHYKAYFSGLCKGMPQNMANNMVLTYLHFRILKISH